MGMGKNENKYKSNPLFSLDETIVPADNTPSENQVNTHEQHTSPRTIINKTDKVENNDFVPLHLKGLVAKMLFVLNIEIYERTFKPDISYR